MIKKTGVVTEDLFLVLNKKDSYDIVAKKGDIVTWSKSNGWVTKDVITIPERFVQNINKKITKVIRKEFEGNIIITISDHEVRLWVCNLQGQNIFRFKTTGKVYQSDTDVIVIPKE